MIQLARISSMELMRDQRCVLAVATGLRLSRPSCSVLPTASTRLGLRDASSRPSFMKPHLSCKQKCGRQFITARGHREGCQLHNRNISKRDRPGATLGGQRGLYFGTCPLRSLRRPPVVCARRNFLNEIDSIRNEDNVAGTLQYDSPLQIVLYPDPRLRAENKLINVFDENLQNFVKEMFDVMYRTDGVGLSAPQVGVNVRLMVYNPTGERGQGKEYVLVNPKIARYSSSTDIDEEGCLSFPNIVANVVRAIGVKVDAQDLQGRKFSISLKGWQARIFQHEYDHLQGVLFHDRMSASVVEGINGQLKELEDAYALQHGSTRESPVVMESG